MSEEKTFEPITSQAEFDERRKARLAREREKWEKESGSADLKAELQSKDEEIAQIRQEHYRADARRAVVDELAAHGVSEQGRVERGRVERILRYVDVDALERAEDGQPRLSSIRGQLADVSKDLPELLSYQLGAGYRRGSQERGVSQEKPLTEEDVSNMSQAEINSQWDRVKGFLAGQR